MREKPILFVRRQGQVLVPHARYDVELIERHRESVRLKCEIWEGRSVPQQRLYWSVLKGVCDATGKWPNSEALHRALKLNLGIIDEVASVDGEILILPGSTAFSKMDAAAFRDYLDSALLLITTDILPGLTVEDILAIGKGRLGADERAVA